MRVIARDTVVRNLVSVATSNLTSQFDVDRSGRLLGRLSDLGDYQIIVTPSWKIELDQKLARAKRR